MRSQAGGEVREVGLGKEEQAVKKKKQQLGTSERNAHPRYIERPVPSEGKVHLNRMENPMEP